MPKVILQRSTRKDKKWMVTLPDGKIIHFGSQYESYIEHGDKKRQQLYILRHQAREDWGNWETAGFWSRWLLWSSPSLSKAIKYMKHKFNIEIRERSSPNPSETH